MSLDERFQAAVDIVQKLPKEGPITTSNEQKLRFYSLYKQATIGDVTTERPGFFSFVERAKWDAWKSVEGLSADQTKETYIDELLKIIEQVREQITIAEWLDAPEIDASVRENLIRLGVSVD